MTNERQDREILCDSALQLIRKGVDDEQIRIALKIGGGNTEAEINRAINGAHAYEKYKKDLDDHVDSAPDHAPEPVVQKKKKPVSAKKKRASRLNGQKGGRPPAPPPYDTAAEWIEHECTEPEGRTLRHYRDAWHHYTPAGWEIVSETEMSKKIFTWLQNRQGVLADNATMNYARNILHNAASYNLCGLPTDTKRPCWIKDDEHAGNWMAFSNGLAVNVWRYAELLSEGKQPKQQDYTRPVSCDLFSHDFVPYKWDPDVYPEKFIAYLERIQPDPASLDAIRQLLGILMADTAKYETFWQLYGKGANGKTVLLDIIMGLLGKQSVSFVPIESLGPMVRFQTFPLEYSKANICGEMATDIGRANLAHMEGTFKDVVSGGAITIERKGVDKYEARCRSRFVISGNSLPVFIDRSEAIWRRLRIIPFPVEIPLAERDSDLAEKICKDELPGIAAWALEGLSEVIKLGHVPDCPAGEEMKGGHRLTCDHEREFLEECYEEAPQGNRVNAQSLYEEYRGWIDDNGYRCLGRAKFYARVSDIFPRSRIVQYRLNDGARARGFEGVRAAIDQPSLDIP